jgi:alanine racemase
MNYKIGELVPLTGLGFLYTHTPELKKHTVTHAGFDSRILINPPKTLFFALEGTTRHGVEFIEHAYIQGCRSFCVPESWFIKNTNKLYKDCSYWVVYNSIIAMQFLAKIYKKMTNGLWIVVAGGKGKSTVKEWLADLLSKNHSIYSSPSSYNSQIGIAISILQAPVLQEYYIIEVGATKEIEYKKVGRMIRADVFVIPSTTNSLYYKSIHLYNKSITTFAREALVICLDRDLVGLSGYLANSQVIACSTAITEPESSSSTDKYDKINLLLVFCVARYLNVTEQRLQEWSTHRQKVEMKLEIIQSEYGTAIYHDSYSSDLYSVRVAIRKFLNQFKNYSTKHIILGELSNTVNKIEYIELIAELFIYFKNNIWLIGDTYNSLKQENVLPDSVKIFDTASSFIQQFIDAPFKQSAVLLKGNNDNDFSKIIPLLSRQGSVSELEINLDALKSNIDCFRSLLPTNKVKLMAMLKASAYGSGAIRLAKEIQNEGVDYIGVAYINEGIELRDAGITTPIFVMNPDKTVLVQLWNYNLEPGVSSLEVLNELIYIAEKRTQPLRVHLEFDTGMSRLGLLPQDLEPVLEKLQTTAYIQPDYLFSHLASAEDPLDDDFTRTQLQLFNDLYTRIRSKYPAIKRHILNSAGIIRWPGYTYDMVRLGISLYGINPTGQELPLVEIGRLKTRISQIKTLGPGASIGYNRTKRLEKPTRIAIIPIGYADGLPRNAGNERFSVLVHGKKCPTLGRICMDMTMIDVSEVPEAVAGDEVVVFGRQEGQFVSISELAQVCGTIPYEILAQIPQRVRRIYTKE